MRFRSNGRLLGGLATLLTLCAAGAGCQSSHHRPEAFAPRAAGRAAGVPIAVAGSPVAPAAPAAAQAAVLYPPQATALPPVTRAAPERGSVIASTWQPVQHLSPQPGFDGGEGANVLPAAPSSGAPATAELHVVARPNLEAPARLPGGARSIASTESGPLVGAETPFVGPAPHPAVEGGAAVLPPALDGHAPPPGAELPPHGIGVPPHHGLLHRGAGLPVAPPPVPREFAKRALSPYIIEPPDILLVQGTAAITLPTQPLAGQFLVRPDGTVGLGIYGSVFVAGMTLDQAATAIATVLQRSFQQAQGPEEGKKEDKGEKAELREQVKRVKALTVEQIRSELQVDVLAYNSKFYYVITDGGGFGEQVYPIPITGNETVLDALSKINGLPPVASKKNIWVARATVDCHNPTILPVDWHGITQRGCAETNYQIFPGDRVYVKADCLIRTDSFLAKFLSPVQRVLGTVLLGSATVNSIKSGSNTGGGAGAVR
jgi:polysaccharide biosynthesis/export protein